MASSKRRHREGMEGIPGHLAAGRVLVRNHDSHRAAFDSLELIDHDAAEHYLAEPAQAALNRGSEPEQIDGIIEVAKLFALVMVMADREQRERDEEDRTRVPNKKESGSGDDIPF